MHACAFLRFLYELVKYVSITTSNPLSEKQSYKIEGGGGIDRLPGVQGNGDY